MNEDFKTAKSYRTGIIDDNAYITINWKLLVQFGVLVRPQPPRNAGGEDTLASCLRLHLSHESVVTIGVQVTSSG